MIANLIDASTDVDLTFPIPSGCFRLDQLIWMYVDVFLSVLFDIWRGLPPVCLSVIHWGSLEF